MNRHLEELESMVKAMSAEERKVVLSCIPVNEILEHLQGTYSKMQDKISKVEAIVKEGD